jgi:glycosyltransferase EpsF
MIRVLNVISGLNNAGTEAVVMNYYRHIDKSKVQFDFLVLDTNDNLYYEKEITNLGGKIYKIPPFTKNPLKNLLQRKKFFKKNKYNIVEVHTPSVHRYGYCKQAKKSGTKYVIFHIHNTCSDKGFFINFARKQVEKYCDETVTCSQTAAISVLGKKADKMVYNAIDYNTYKFNSQKRLEIRSYFNINENNKVVGHIGRFSKQKNQSFLLDAFALAVERDKSLILLIKGFGECEAEIKEKIFKLNISENVIIADNKYCASELYNSFDLFLLPSIYEGLPMVLIEAQANGLKAVVSDNVTTESNISGFVMFERLDTKIWSEYLLKEEMFNRVSITEFDFTKSNYNILSATKKRESDYLNKLS